ncbi:MAG: Non-classical phosphatidylinositol transfer protein (PITP) [Phylliscum demangeonii]|nr:MAG: Non-classical phosphatidylinositol transfer protein (PITP) [Phylliscum demangeonii]
MANTGLVDEASRASAAPRTMGEGNLAPAAPHAGSDSGAQSTAVEVDSDEYDPQWPALGAGHPLRKFQDRLPSILQGAGYEEVYGVQLSGQTPVPFSTTLILQKFLRANANQLELAVEQLKATLIWRKEFQPLRAAQDEVFDEQRFGGLGYITVVETDDGSGWRDVITWNIYGAVTDSKRTFGDLDGFLRWRVALMERSIRHLHLDSACAAIPDYGQGPDPYQMIQVHDYLSVRFLRMDGATRAASQRTIALFQSYYPELLVRKFFVNVPFVMGWLYSAMKVFVAKETAKKLTMLSYGNQLADQIGSHAVPVAYGGHGEPLAVVGETVSSAAAAAAAAAAPAAAAAAAASRSGAVAQVGSVETGSAHATAAPVAEKPEVVEGGTMAPVPIPSQKM